MGPGDWIAVGAAVLSLVALIVSLRHRREDVAREEAAHVRARVWEILSGEAGLRSIDALDADDGKTAMRLTLLGRTAEQLGVAGAGPLRNDLKKVLEEHWGPSSDEQALQRRAKFVDAATRFMTPAADRRRRQPNGGIR